MEWQPVIDFVVTIFVLVAIVVLAYCAIRKKGIKDMWEEIRGLFGEKTEETKEKLIYG